MSFLYNLVFKRTSTYVVGIVASVFFFERGFDVAADAIFDNHNKGVRTDITCRSCVLHNKHWILFFPI